LFTRTSDRPAEHGIGSQLGRSILILLGCLLTVEVAVRIFLPVSHLLTGQNEVISSADLVARLDALRDFDGMRIVGIGDSVMHGATMAAHGNPNWREDTITSQLARLFRASGAGNVSALNLGLNGALPGDYEQLVSKALTAKPDLLVINSSMRSFSADFSTDDELLSRDWLSEFEVRNDGTFSDLGSGPNPLSIEAELNTALMNHWHTYRYRDALQQLVFAGTPRDAMARLLKYINSIISSKITPVESPLFTLLKSKLRYSSIELGPQNPQLQYLRRALLLAQAENVPVVLVYSRENPAAISDVIDPPSYSQHIEDFASFASQFDSATFAYVPPIKEIKISHYLDLVHVNSEGYEVYTDKIYEAAIPLLHPEKLH